MLWIELMVNYQGKALATTHNRQTLCIDHNPVFLIGKEVFKWQVREGEGPTKLFSLGSTNAIQESDWRLLSLFYSFLAKYSLSHTPAV